MFIIIHAFLFLTNGTIWNGESKKISKVLYTLWILCLPIFLFKEFCTQAILYMWEYSVISFEFVVTQLS